MAILQAVLFKIIRILWLMTEISDRISQFALKSQFQKYWRLPVNNSFLCASKRFWRIYFGFFMKRPPKSRFLNVHLRSQTFEILILHFSNRLKLLQFNMLNNCFTVTAITPNIRWQKTFKCPLTHKKGRLFKLNNNDEGRKVLHKKTRRIFEVRRV